MATTAQPVDSGSGEVPGRHFLDDVDLHALGGVEAHLLALELLKSRRLYLTAYNRPPGAVRRCTIRLHRSCFMVSCVPVFQHLMVADEPLPHFRPSPIPGWCVLIWPMTAGQTSTSQPMK